MVILTKDIGIKFEERFAGKTIVRVNISDAVEARRRHREQDRQPPFPERLKALKGAFAPSPQHGVYHDDDRTQRLKASLFAQPRENLP